MSSLRTSIDRQGDRPKPQPIRKPRRKPKANPRDRWPAWTDARISLGSSARPVVFDDPHSGPAILDAFYRGVAIGEQGRAWAYVADERTPTLTKAFTNGVEEGLASVEVEDWPGWDGDTVVTLGPAAGPITFDDPAAFRAGFAIGIKGESLTAPGEMHPDAFRSLIAGHAAGLALALAPDSD